MKKYIHSTIIFAILAIPSAIIISYLFEGPSPDDFINSLIAQQLIYEEALIMLNVGYRDIAEDIHILLAQMQIGLLLLTYVYIIILDVLDTIKIALHWLIKSAIFLIFIILINTFYLNSAIFAGPDLISTYGVVILNFYLSIYYLTMFLIILIVKNWLSKKQV